MKVNELMTSEVITVDGEASLKEAARRMISAGVSGLVVTDKSGGPSGVITEADFVKNESDRRSSKRARLLRWLTPDQDMPTFERTVADVMTSELVTITPDADHAEAARLMRKCQIKRLPVVDENQALVGILSRSDIMRAFVRPDDAIIDELQERVMRQVLWIDPRKVDVHVVEGNVVLEGHLETRADADLLEELAGRLDGVVSVKNRLSWEIDNTELEMTSPPPSMHTRRNWPR